MPHRAPSRARRFLDSGYASARNDKGTLTAPGVHYTAPPDALSRPFRSRCPHPSTTRRTSLLSFRPSEPLVISTERQRAEKSKARSFQKEKASQRSGGLKKKCDETRLFVGDYDTSRTQLGSNSCAAHIGNRHRSGLAFPNDGATGRSRRSKRSAISI